MAIGNHLTVREVAEFLGVTEARVRQFVMERRLVPDRVGQMLFFPREHVQEFAQQPRPTGRPKNIEK